jgi:RNA polymerase sigma factor (sigma-70 family)
MAGESVNAVIRYLQKCIGWPRAGDRTDGELLERFAREHEEGAFETLVQRHGGMVWGVCRRLLGDQQDAEDAFQATFLVLVRKGGSLRQPELLANWLYGVACRTARKARVEAVQRRVHERKSGEMSRVEAGADEAWGDLRPLLDEELERLPLKYRAPLVLCYLEGKTYVEAAEVLGWSRGTVSGRLVRAREILRTRLARRGVALSGGLLATVLSQNAGAAMVPAGLCRATVQAAACFAVGQAARAGVVSARVGALTEGVLKAMWFTKLKIVAAVVLSVAAVGTALGMFTADVLATKPEGAPAPLAAADPPQPVSDTNTNNNSNNNSTNQPPAVEKDKPKAEGGWKVQSTLQGHKATVRAVAFSQDGKTLATAGDDRTARLWDVATGQEKTVLEGHQGTVTCVAFTPDGKTIATGSFDRTIKLWDVATGKARTTLTEHKAPVTALAIAPDGKTLATASFDMTVKLWDIATAKERDTLLGAANCLAFSPDGKELATGGNDATVKLWTVATAQERTALKGHKGPVLSLAFAPDGKTLAAASADVKVWDTTSGQEQTTTGQVRGRMYVVAFTPDGKTLTIGTTQSTLQQWDVATGKEQAALDGGHKGALLCIAFAPDGKTMATGSSDQTVKVWQWKPKEDKSSSAN